MGFLDKYPYTDFHELNLDWIIGLIKELNETMDEWTAINKIKIGGTWDISKAYEPWTIVDDGNFGYLSIQAVPAGTLLTNTDYWLLVANYSGVIIALQTRVAALESTVGDASSGLVKQTDDNTNDITLLNSSVSTLTGNVSNLATLVNTSNVVDGKIICIGDSYLQGYNPDGDTTPWGTHLMNFLNKTASDVYSYADGGCGFVAIGQNGNRFEDLIRTAANDVSFDNKDVSLIIIGGGFNDAANGASNSDLSTRFGNCESLISANFVNAKTVVAFMGAAQSPEVLVTYDKLYNAIMRYNNNAQIHNMSYIYDVGIALKGAGNTLGSDGIHPNNDGQVIIAKAIYNFILNGNTIGFKHFFDYTGINLYAIADDKTVLLDFFSNEDNYMTIANYTCNGANLILEYNVEDLGFKPILGASYLTFWTKNMIRANGNYYFVDCYTKLTWDGKIRFYPHAIADDHSGYLSVTNVDLFVVLPQVVVLPRFLM